MIPARQTAPGRESTADLASILKAISGKDERALAKLYDDTVSSVHGVVTRILSDLQIAEETTLDVYLHVWEKAGSYAPHRGSPLAWLLSIARHRAIDRWRSLAARRRREGAFSECLDTSPHPQADPAHWTISEERRQRVSAAIGQLPVAQKRCIELAYFQGMSHSEIASHLDAPLGTIKGQIRLGMMKLREALTPLEAGS